MSPSPRPDAGPDARARAVAALLRDLGPQLRRAVGSQAADSQLGQLVFVQVGVGLGHSWSANFPVVVFGLFTLPSLLPPDEALKKALAVVHFWGGWVLLALIAGHVGAALHHHFVRKDAVLKRMLPWVRV